MSNMHITLELTSEDPKLQVGTTGRSAMACGTATPDGVPPARRKDTSNYVTVTEKQLYRMQVAALKELPSKERWPLDTAPVFLAMNSGLVGFICNSYFRRMLMIRKGLILSSMATGLLPAVTNLTVFNHLITKPVVMGDIDCPLCIQLRGSTINLGVGVIMPFALGLSLNAAFAISYDTVPIPFPGKKTSLRDVLEFWVKKSRFFKLQFVTLAIFQTLVGGFIADKQNVLARAELLKTFDRLKLDLRDNVSS